MNDFREFSRQYNDYLMYAHDTSTSLNHSSNDFREFSKEYNDYLMHFGILGMHWGIRRYQNPDGTLTAAGKARYNKINAKADEYDKKSWR